MSFHRKVREEGPQIKVEGRLRVPRSNGVFKLPGCQCHEPSVVDVYLLLAGVTHLSVSSW